MTILINILLGVILTLALFYAVKSIVTLHKLRKQNVKNLALKAAAIEAGYRRLDAAMNLRTAAYEIKEYNDSRN